MTGSEIKSLLSQEVDTAYSGYTDDTKLNRWFKKAFVNVVQNIYNGRLENQNAFEMSFLISTSTPFSLNSNQIYTAPLLIANITNVTVTVTVTTELAHNLIIGDTVTLSGVSGFATNNPNGTFTVIAPLTSTTFTFTASLAPTGAYTANSGTLTSPKLISDYYHYLYGQVIFNKGNTYSIASSTNTTPIRITLNKRGYFRTGDKVLIAGVLGNTNANGTRYLKQSTDYNYFLYSDATLQTAVVGNGTQSNTNATIAEVVESALKFKPSDEKGTFFGGASVYSPFFQQSKLLIKILPTTDTCTTLTLDYIRIPPQFIDVTNTTVDLSTWYPLYFQYQLISEVGKLFSFASRDPLLGQEEQQLLNETP